MTYNAYLVDGGDGRCVLFDGWPAGYGVRLAGVVGRLCRRVEMIVSHHSEPDHTGCLPVLVERLGVGVVASSPAGVRVLRSLYPGLGVEYRALRDGETVSAGGVEFTAYHVPMLHWPDTMASVLHGPELLLSCDVFGGFSVPQGISDEDVDPAGYLPYARKYFATVVGRYRSRVPGAVEKLGKAGFRAIAPGHGLLWLREPQVIVDAYLSWAEGRPRDKLLVVGFTAYGRAGRIADIAVEEAGKVFREVSVYMYTHWLQPHPAEVLGEVPDSAGILLVTITYEAGLPPVIEWLLSLMAAKTAYRKPVAVVSLHAWGPPVAEKAAKQLAAAGFNPVYTASMKGLASEETIRELVGKAVEALHGGHGPSKP